MAEHWNGGSGGKGSKPRPYSVSKEVFDANMDVILGDRSEEKARKQKEKDEYFARLAAETKARLENSSGTKNDYQDVLSTEDCLIDSK